MACQSLSKQELRESEMWNLRQHISFVIKLSHLFYLICIPLTEKMTAGLVSLTDLSATLVSKKHIALQSAC